MDYEFRKYSLVYKGKSKGIIPHNKVSETLNSYAYHFFPEVPMYVDGVTVNIYGFDTKEEIIDFVKNNTDEDCTTCMDERGGIIEVHHDGHPWYVLGYTNLDAWTFPNWLDYKESDKARKKREKEAKESWDKYEIIGIKILDAKTGEERGELKFKPVCSERLENPEIIYPSNSSKRNAPSYCDLQTAKNLNQNIDFALKAQNLSQPIFTNISKKNTHLIHKLLIPITNFQLLTT